MSVTKLDPSERDCTNTIIAAALRLGFMVHHCRPAQLQSGRWGTPIQGTVGFPDLIVVGYGHVLAVELKRGKNKASDGQVQWINALEQAGVSAEIVYVPAGQQSLIDRLARLAHPSSYQDKRQP